MTASRSGTLTLRFDRTRLTVGDDTDIRRQLSAVAMVDDTLWLACDEGCRLERLSRRSDSVFDTHAIFPLHDLMPMPAKSTEEADVEGLHADAGYLWMVGSHSVKRKKPKNDSPTNVAERIAETSRDGNRHILARVPLVGNELMKKDVAGGRRSAALDASPESSPLLDAVRKARDPHLAAWIDLPGKDNGFDIEGLAVRGGRAWIGLRGPVLREWCCILELNLEADGKRLQLARIDGFRYRKHFLNLHGLGIRDLTLLEDDILILTGPTMAHDGPGEIWRWKGGARPNASVAASRLTRLLTLPQQSREDKAEALAVIEHDGAPAALIVYDSPAAGRLAAPAAVTADIFRL